MPIASAGAWIHTWMIAALVVTPAGLAGLAAALAEPAATVLTAMATTVYVLGGACWIASLVLRLTVVPWAAERTVADGHVPDGFAAYDRWAGRCSSAKAPAERRVSWTLHTGPNP